MGHMEGFDTEIAQIQLQPWFDAHLQLWCYLPCDAVVTVYSLVYETGRIDRHLVVMTEGAHRLDMVSVIVGDQQMIDLVQVHTIVLTVLLQGTYTYADIYDECVCGGAEIVTITTAPASKRNKLQHLILNFCAKLKKNEQNTKYYLDF